MQTHDDSGGKNDDMEKLTRVLSANQSTLEEILKWMKVMGIEKVKHLLESSLDTPEKRLVFHLSDGKTIREINSLCGVSLGSVSKYWNRWHRMGLMKKNIVKGGGERYQKNFELEDYEIDVPRMATKASQNKVEATVPPQEDIQ